MLFNFVIWIVTNLKTVKLVRYTNYVDLVTKKILCKCQTFLFIALLCNFFVLIILCYIVIEIKARNKLPMIFNLNPVKIA